MKKMCLFLFSVVILVFVFLGICPVVAKAPETAKIVFSANRDGNRDIYLMNPDGTQQINITNHHADDVAPTFSPTGDQILFASDRGNPAPGTWDLYLMDVDGRNVQKVFGKRAVRTDSTWSPDGKQIAYRRMDLGGPVIYIATMDEKKEERVAIGAGPAWSPNGTEIAFVNGAPERKQISILNLHTRKAKILFPAKPEPSWIPASLAWSPKGDRIAFSWLHRVPLKDFLETETIYIVNRDGTGLLQVIDEAGPSVDTPVWSPQGDEILYMQHDGKAQWSWQIFRVALAGGQSEQLTHIGIWNSPADWFDPAYALPVSPQPQLLTTIWGEVKKGSDP